MEKNQPGKSCTNGLNTNVRLSSVYIELVEISKSGANGSGIISNPYSCFLQYPRKKSVGYLLQSGLIE
jgi:hypothetical protein